MNKLEVRKMLGVALDGRGFYQRGDAYFRVVGDGVLQLLKFEYERSFSHFSLCVGLFSMYSELDRKWFTSSGCIPQYSVMNFAGKASAVNINKEKDIYTFEVLSPQAQIRTLDESAFSALDRTDTQIQLIDQMNQLDIARWGTIVWNDLNKFAPYLKSGDFKSAEKVLTSVLRQYNYLAYDEHDLPFSFSDGALDGMGSEAKALLQKFALLHNVDQKEINNYLLCNQKRNNCFARFCAPSQ